MTDRRTDMTDSWTGLLRGIRDRPEWGMRDRHLPAPRRASPAREAARLRQLTRILAQWDAQEVAAMRGPDADGIAMLRRMRQAILDQLEHRP